jgi:diacylglycerol kinase family enzyme
VRDGTARARKAGLAEHAIGRLFARVVLRAGATVEEADPSDGALEVVAIEAGPRLGLVSLAYHLRKGDLTSHPRAYHKHCDDVAVQVPDGTRFNVDGELVTEGDARFRAMKGAFRLVIG